jgi:phosphotransferase system enzyme I (PtsI)
MISINGIAAAPGIAIATALVSARSTHEIPTYGIATGDVEREFWRFQRAVREAQQDLHEIAEQLSEISELDAQLLESHGIMLEDPELANQVQAALTERLCNVEQVVVEVIERMIEKLQAVQDQHIRERVADLQDVRRRLLERLLARPRLTAVRSDAPAVLVCHSLMPTDAFDLAKRGFIAIATDVGGQSSHLAIIARALELPAVVGLSSVTRDVRGGDEIIVDGNSGTVVINPTAAVRQDYLSLLERWQKRELLLLGERSAPARTLDGSRIRLHANIEFATEVRTALSHGAEGVGLFRSEFLYLEAAEHAPTRGGPSEEQQFIAYQAVLQEMGDRPVTIRTIDIGGDKVTPEFDLGDERNPILGFRAIRLSHAYPEVFKRQLRALYRASVFGNLRIMFPMISSVEELETTLDFVAEVLAELDSEGIENRVVPLGAMIEVPAAAICADMLAEHVDFFSLGSNDLLQYTAAVDRDNDRVAYLYRPLQPAMLRLLRMVVEAADKAGIELSLCGEIAGDPSIAAVLVGMGFRELSIAAIGIPDVKEMIGRFTIAEAEALVADISRESNTATIELKVQEWLKTLQRGDPTRS